MEKNLHERDPRTQERKMKVLKYELIRKKRSIGTSGHPRSDYRERIERKWNSVEVGDE